MLLNHEHYMQLAMDQAVIGGNKNEVPIGAVLVSSSGGVLAAAYNSVIECSDPTAHAEILVLRKYGRQIGNYRLLNTALYVTIEPCFMCMGAIIHARVESVVFGTGDAKWGAAGSLYDFSADRRLNHHPEVVSGVCKKACRVLIQDFFRRRRNKNR